MIITDSLGTSLSLKLLAACGDALMKGTVIMFAAGWITTAMRKASPAARHLVWAIALCGALVLPILSAVVPTLRISLLPRITAVAHPNLAALELRSPPLHGAAAGTRPVRNVRGAAGRHATTILHTASGVAAAPGIAPVAAPHGDTAAVVPTGKTGSLAPGTWHRIARRWPLLLLSIWGIGAAVVGLAGLIGHWSVAQRLARARTISTGPIALMAGKICRELKLRRPTRIALDANLRIPLAHGVFRPCVLLPIAAESWPREKLRTVLLHELAHVARWDCASLLGGLIACTLHWPDPLAWWGWRRLRSECERACDDVVLRCATPPADYAENLLTIVRSLHSSARSLPRPATLAMARPSELKGRIAAILDDRKNRRPISVRLAVGMLIGGALAVASCAALHLQASPPLPDSHLNNKATAARAPAPRKTMTLTVIDKRTGDPLAGVKVDSQINLGGATDTVTDENGRATISLTHAHSAGLRIFLKARHYVWQQLIWNSHNGNPANIPSNVTVAMPRGTEISGHVVDDAGHPVAGAHVMLWINAKAEAPHEKPFVVPINLRTNRDGAWHYGGTPVTGVKSIGVGVWDYHYVFAPSHGFQNGIVELQRVHHLKEFLNGTAVFTLHRGIMVHGFVLGPDGKPVAGAAVAVGPDRNASNELSPIMTDAKGRFTFAAKPTRWGVVVTATAQGFGPALMHSSVSKGQKPIVLRLSPPHTLTGQVVNLEGRPLAGAMVYTDTWRGYRTLIHAMRTDYDGRFVWDGAPAGEILVDAQSRGYAYTMNIPTRWGKVNRITLRPILKVFGTVISAKTGRPIHKFRLIRGSASSPGYPSSLATWDSQSALAVTDDGRFTQTFPYQYPAYAIRIEAKGYRPADSKLFANEGRALHLRFRLQRASGITARVLNPDGTPAAGAKALLVPTGSAGIIDTAERPANSPSQDIHTADKMGRLDFAPPATGYEIAVYNQLGYAEWSSDQPPKKGVVKLKRWGSIRGQVRFGTKVAPKQRVDADIMTSAESNGAGPTVQWQGITRTDSNGNFFISHMPSGDARLAVVGKEHFITAYTSVASRALQNRVRVKSGKTSHIMLGGVGCTVEGAIEIPPALARRHDWYFFPGDAFINPPPLPASLQLPMPEGIKHGPAIERAQWAKNFLATPAGKALSAKCARWWQAHRREYNLRVRRDGTFSIMGMLPGTYLVHVEAGLKGAPYGGGAIGTVDGTFTVPPIPGGVTDVPLKIPPLKLVPVKVAKP